eukprot:2425978-Amphidinium_carterae.1
MAISQANDEPYPEVGVVRQPSPTLVAHVLSAMRATRIHDMTPMCGQCSVYPLASLGICKCFDCLMICDVMTNKTATESSHDGQPTCDNLHLRYT